MPKKIFKPVIDVWYITDSLTDVFKVVALDHSDQTINIQFFSGEIGGMDFDVWRDLRPREIPAPDDCSGPYELNLEDLDYYQEDPAYYAYRNNLKNRAPSHFNQSHY